MALELSGSINISGSMTATTIVVSSPGVAGMVSSSAQIGELVPLMQSTSSINNLTGSLITTSSNNVIAIDGLNTYTASIKAAIEVSGQNVNVLGTLTAQEIYTTYVTSSVMFKSGSTKFGDDTGDRHEFTGSLNVSGGLLVNGTSAVTITSNTAGNNTLNLVSTNSANSGKLQFGGATYGATIEKNSLGADNGLVFNSYHGGAEGYTFQSNGATKLKVGGSGRTEVTGSFNVYGEIRMDGSTVFIGMSSNTLQLCGGTSSSNVKINGASEEITIDTNGATRVTIASTGTSTFNGLVAGTRFNPTYVTSTSGYENITNTVSTAGGVYYFVKDSGAGEGSSATTFNITGVPDTDGVGFDLTLVVKKSATVASINTSAIVQINGVTIGEISTVFASGTAAVTTIKTARMVRVGGNWRPMGGIGTY